MKNSCWWRPCVKNNNGEDVVSKLWDDIYRLTGNDREKSKELYKIATDENFINTVKDQVDFDENGQITAHSFFKVSGLSGEINDTLKTINDEYSKDNVSSEEAIENIEKFNRDESYKEEYVPQLIYQGDDKYSITFTERDESSVEDLQKKINDIQLTKFIAQRLRELGVAYDFVGKSQHAGRFSTRNAERMADSLYHLVSISTGKDVDPNDVLLEESAHFATIAMKDDSLIKRLLATINADTIGDLFTEEEIKTANLNTQEGKLELAGLLVKKALSNKYGRVLGYDNFLSRIKQKIFSVFSKLKLDALLSDKQRANLYAEQIANGFLYDDSSLKDVDTIVKESNVELFSLSLDGTNKLLQESLQRISELQSNVRNASTALWDSLLKDVRPGALTHGAPIDSFSYEEAAGIIGSGTTNILESFKLVVGELDKINFEGDINQEDLMTLFAATEMFSAIKDLTNLARTYLADKREENINVINSLNEGIKTVDDFFAKDSGIAQKILDSQRLMTAQIFEAILGSNTYKESARIVFKPLNTEEFRKQIEERKKRDLKNKDKEFVKEIWHIGDAISDFFNSKLHIENGPDGGYSTYTLASRYVNERPYTMFNKIANLVRHSNNAEDITTQLFYQAIRRLKVNESRLYKESLIELSKLEKEVKDAGISVTDFYEKYDDGSFTGNFIGKYNFAQLRQDREDTLNKIKKDFIEYLHSIGTFDDFMHQTKEEKVQQFIEFRDMRSDWLDVYNLSGRELDALNSWLNHDDESQLTPDIIAAKEEILKLLSKYVNNEYLNLLDKYENFEDILNKIKSWKEELDDSCLREYVEGSEEEDVADKSYKLFVRDRLPMFKGGTITRLKNKRLIKNNDLYNQRHIHEINLDVTSEEFGCPLMDSKLDEFNDQYSLASDAIRRIPLYGINKLDDMTQLSTNLFESLSVYAGMAHRYHSTQELYPQLKLVDETLQKRENNPAIGNDIRAKNISNESRREMMEQYVTPKNKRRNIIVNVLGKLGMIASVRVLCINIMSALKNWNGGYRVILNDAISGNANFSIRDLFAATKRNFNPKHTISSLATICLNKEQTWDKYQNLIRRWDAARNPHVHTVVGANTWKKVFNYITNIIMSNYSLTDESLIAIIYDSYMNNKILYDASTGNRVRLATEGYNYDDKKNPSLKPNLVKRSEDIELWNKLKSALSAINDIKENNSVAEKDDEKLRLSDKHEITDLLDYVENVLNKTLPIYNEYGGFKSVEDVEEVLNKELRRIMFTEDDEVVLCEQINDYITSSQGLYGALNANAIQSNAELAMFSKLKGWLFGFIQRNVLSNPSALSGDYKSSVWGSTLLALACIFGNTKYITGTDDFKENFKFKTAIICATFIPFALMQRTDKKSGNKLDNQLRKYLERNGWSPDQLNKLSFFVLGWFIQWGLHVMSQKILSRGNYKKFGDYIKQNEAKRKGKPKKLEEHGLLFNEDLITFNQNKFNSDFEKWKKQGFPYSLGQKKKIDGKVGTYKGLPKVTNLNFDKYKNAIYQTVNDGKYYKYNEKKHRWVEFAYGHYTPGTEEWNEHIDAMKYSNYGYDTQSVAYHLLGAAYRLSRGIEDEGVSLMNTFRMYSDVRELADPILFSAGISVVYKGVELAIQGRFDDWADREKNFWLNKFGLELDGDGYPIFKADTDSPITLMDWYEKQESIDRYQNFKNK